MKEFVSKSWQEGRGWLEDDEAIGMTCSACKKVGNPKAGKHSFNLGSKYFRLSAVTDHETSTCHNRTVEILKSREDAKKKSTTAPIKLC